MVFGDPAGGVLSSAPATASAGTATPTSPWLLRIGNLIAEGINLTGIARVLGLEADNAGLHASTARARNCRP